MTGGQERVLGGPIFETATDAVQQQQSGVGLVALDTHSGTSTVDGDDAGDAHTATASAGFAVDSTVAAVNFKAVSSTAPSSERSSA